MQINWFLIIIGIIAFLLFVPIFIKLKINFNVLDNLGTVRFYVFGVRVYFVKIKFSKNQINIIGKKKEKNINLNFNDAFLRFVNQLIYQLFLKIKITQFCFNAKFGKNGDAFWPAMLCGIEEVFIYVLLGYCYTKKGVFNTNLKNNITSEKDECNLEFLIKAVFNLFMILISVITAKFRNRGDRYAKSTR